MGPRLLVLSQERAPAPSVVLITAEMPEASPPAGGRALAVASMGVDSMAVVGGTGDRMYPRVKVVANLRMEGNTMLQGISIFVQRECRGFVRFAASALFAFFLGSSFAPTFAQQRGQRTFASTEDASAAFFAAMQATQNDQSLLGILGPAGEDVISSGDLTEGLDARVGFVVKYKEMHRFVTEPNGTVTLVVGAENWPFPIPLVNNHGSWYFDTPAGKDEILLRRIGSNESAAMDACRNLVQAQKRYFARPSGNLSKQFAQRLVSDEGRHNGLYWQGTNNEFDSPINPLIAFANGKDKQDRVGDQIPFNGYFFRILTRQGPHARGGAKNYIVDGKITAGFAFVAYPAEYRSSGVMTFIVNQSGTIYENDLGPNTTKLAEAMTDFDPDSTWYRAQ